MKRKNKDSAVIHNAKSHLLATRLNLIACLELAALYRGQAKLRPMGFYRRDQLQKFKEVIERAKWLRENLNFWEKEFFRFSGERKGFA